MLKNQALFFVIFLCLATGCSKEDAPDQKLVLLQAFMGATELDISGTVTSDLPTDRSISLNFSNPINQTSAVGAITLKSGSQVVAFDITFSSQDKTIVLFPTKGLIGNTTYSVAVSDQLQGAKGESVTAAEFSFRTLKPEFKITSLVIGTTEYLASSSTVQNIDPGSNFTIGLSSAIDFNTVTNSSVTIKDANGVGVELEFSMVAEAPTYFKAMPKAKLKSFMRYSLVISSGIKDSEGSAITPLSKNFFSGINPDPVFAMLPNDEDSDADNTNDLLSVVQSQTFKYFWDFGHPISGMARERNTSGDVVTSGGSGFGIMALVVGMERNFITRSAGIERMNKIVTFLETADRFHGAWSHWIDGSSGKVIPFSDKDNGGDLVETSFLVQGLITFRQYLQPGVTEEALLITRITKLWEGVEWDWYRKDNASVLYWHWSPSFNWDINFALSGYFEEQVTYFLAASSPTHGIPKDVYTNGYGKNGGIVKNNAYYNYILPLESPAPLFWVQYSYLGLDPHFSDAYANYWQQNVNATLINQAYCAANPKGYIGYSDQCWGLTASDNQGGYDAHSPTNDKGVITPTAALSSFPYAPTESMKALKFFYYSLGDRLWGEYGFYDAFNLTEGWTATSYLAIDQGPIIVMIENYRTGLLWDLFMSAPEMQAGKTVLGFTN